MLSNGSMIQVPKCMQSKDIEIFTATRTPLARFFTQFAHCVLQCTCKHAVNAFCARARTYVRAFE